MAKTPTSRAEPTSQKGQLLIPIIAALAGVGLFFLPMADLIHTYDPDARVRFWTLDYITFLAFVMGIPLLLMQSKGLALRLVVTGISLLYVGWSQLRDPHIPGVSELALIALGLSILIFARRARLIRGLLLLYALAYFGFLQGACPRVPGALELILLHITDDDHQIVMHVIKVGAVIGFGILFGRYYCGWICPKGIIQEYIFRPQLKVKVPPRVDRILKYGKYLMLALLIFFPLFMEAQLFRHIGPFRVIFNLDGAVYAVAFLGVVLGTSVFIERAYCRYFCPEGGLLALAQILSPHRVRLDTDACSSCGRCLKVCPVDAIPSVNKCTPKQISRTECITCLECRAVCRDDAIYYGLRRRPDSTSTVGLKVIPGDKGKD